MVRGRIPWLLGAGSLLIATPFGCDVPTPSGAPGINVPPTGATGDTGNGADDGLDNGDDGQGGADDNKPDSGPEDGPGDDDNADNDDGPKPTDTGEMTSGTTGDPAPTSTTDDTTTAGSGEAGGVAGDCCEANGTPSCDAMGCADAVCGEDPFCCDTQWDDACVAIAAGMGDCECEGAGEVGGDGGDCCEPHKTTGCDIQECEDTICGNDSFCCEDQWDDICAGDAVFEPSCGCEMPGTGTTEGGETGDPGDGMLVINEILYDHPGADVDVFIEIAGVPGTSLTGVSLEAINGNGGATYDTLDLSGSIGPSGFYLIVDPAAGAALQDLADEVDGIGDLQNGPDSVRLLVDGVEVDALGYGSFSGGETFAGEGMPAPDINSTMSLSRMGDTDDNATDFVEAVATPGAMN